MEILKPGKAPEEYTRPWWVGMTGTCRTCTTEVRIQDADRPIEQSAERSPDGRRWATFDCPTFIHSQPSAHIREWACPGHIEIIRYGAGALKENGFVLVGERQPAASDCDPDGRLDMYFPKDGVRRVSPSHESAGAIAFRPYLVTARSAEGAP